MLIQLNNTLLVNDVNDVPLDRLKLLTQLIIFEERYIDEINLTLDNISNLILREKIFGHVYVFSKIENRPHVYWDPDIESEELDKVEESGDKENFITHAINKNIDYESEESSEYYILLANKLYKLTSSHNRLDVIDGIYYLNEEPHYVLYHEIYKKLFINSNNESTYFSTKIKESIVHYVTLPLDKNNSLIVSFNHNIKTTNRYWIANCEIAIINRENQLIKIRCKYEELIEIIQKLEVSNYIYPYYSLPSYVKDKFIQYYNVFKYDVKDSINDCGVGLKNVHDIFTYNLDYMDIEKFYQPIYENKTLKFKAYQNTVRSHSGDIIFTVDSKILSTWEISYYDIYKENYHKFLDEIRIAKELLGFEMSTFGVNPVDGNFYIDREIDNSVIGYRDDEGIMARHKGYALYYYKLNGYFIQTKDQIIIDQIVERRNLMNKLVESV